MICDGLKRRQVFIQEANCIQCPILLSFLNFPQLISLINSGLGLTIFVASKIKNWQKLENILVADWLTNGREKGYLKKSGCRLLKAKLGENYKNTSAAFIWTTIQRMYAARKSGLKKEMFGYITGGYEKINNTFTTYLIETGVAIKYNSPGKIDLKKFQRKDRSCNRRKF